MAVSIRERLAAKSARRVLHEIATAEPTEEFQAAQRAKVALALAEKPRDGSPPVKPAELKRLAADARKTQKAYDDLFVPVWLRSLSSSDYEDLVNLHMTDDPDGTGEPGVDWAAALPDFMAACCEDPDLQDSDYWRETLAGPGWTNGNLLDLRYKVISLNMDEPQRLLGKG